jgi:hypothetical protein
VARDRKVGFVHRVHSAGRIGSIGPASASFSVSPRAPIGARAPDKRRFYECQRPRYRSAAIFDLLQSRGLIGAQSHAQARLRLVRVVQMLTRMSGTPRDARIPPSSLGPPSRGRYRGRGRACVSDPTQRNMRRIIRRARARLRARIQ